jgi:hypothetical protein
MKIGCQPKLPLVELNNKGIPDIILDLASPLFMPSSKSIGDLTNISARVCILDYILGSTSSELLFSDHFWISDTIYYLSRNLISNPDLSEHEKANISRVCSLGLLKLEAGDLDKRSRR